jgi:hypothetical protein
MTTRSTFRSAALQLIMIVLAIAAPAAYAAQITVHVDDTTVARAPEKGGAAAFVVKLDQPVPKGSVLTLDWITVDGTAVSNTDYTPAKGTITITPADKTLKVLGIVMLLPAKSAAPKRTFEIKVKASITGDNTVKVGNPDGKATATMYTDTTARVAPRAN